MTSRKVVVDFNGEKYTSSIVKKWKAKLKSSAGSSRSGGLTSSWTGFAGKKRGREVVREAVDRIKKSERYKSFEEKLSRQLDKLSAEADSDSFWKTMAGELFGSLFFVLFTAGSTFKAGVHEAVGATALCSGFCQVAIMYCFGTDGHFNSSVSIGVACAGLMKKRLVLVRAGCHFVGSLFACIVLNRLSSGSTHRIGVFFPSSGVTGFKAFLGECLSSLIFVFVFLFCHKKTTGIVAIGCSLTAIMLFIIPYTGGCLNPSRGLSSAMASNCWTYQWVFLLAPTFGAISAGCLYRSITTDVVLRSFEKFYTFLKRKNQVVAPKSETYSVDEEFASKMSTFSDYLEMTSPKYDLKFAEPYLRDPYGDSDSNSDSEFTSWDVLAPHNKGKCKTVHWNPNVIESTKEPEQVEGTEEINNDTNELTSESFVCTEFCDPTTDRETFIIVGNSKMVSAKFDVDDTINIEKPT